LLYYFEASVEGRLLDEIFEIEANTLQEAYDKIRKEMESYFPGNSDLVRLVLLLCITREEKHQSGNFEIL